MQSVTVVAVQRYKRKGPIWSGDPSTAPRCGARTRVGRGCRAPAMVNPVTGNRVRCRMHGGASTGPRTPEGMERSRKADWRHGGYSAERQKLRREARRFIQWSNSELKALAREFKALQRAFRREGAVPPQLPALYPYISLDKPRP